MKTPEYIKHMIKMQKIQTALLSSISLILAEKSGSEEIIRTVISTNEDVVKEMNKITKAMEEER